MENYDAVSPFVSRLPSGLHVFFTPRKDALKDYICPMIHKVFSEDLKCKSVKVGQSISFPPHGDHSNSIRTLSQDHMSYQDPSGSPLKHPSNTIRRFKI